MWSLQGIWKWTWIKMVYVSWPRWPPCHIWWNSFCCFYLLLWIQKADALKLGMQHWLLKYYQVKWWSCVHLDLFYSKVKFFHFCFCMSKCLNCRFLRNYWSLLEVSTYCQINVNITIYDNPRSRSFIDLCPTSLRFNIFKLFFLKTHQAIEAKFHMKPPWNVGNKNLFQCSRWYDQDLLLRMTMNLIYSIGYSSTSRVVQMTTLDWPWPFHDSKSCFPMPLHGWKLIQHIFMYFQACSNSAYPQHSGERHRTIGPLISFNSPS